MSRRKNKMAASKKSKKKIKKNIRKVQRAKEEATKKESVLTYTQIYKSANVRKNVRCISDFSSTGNKTRLLCYRNNTYDCLFVNKNFVHIHLSGPTMKDDHIIITIDTFKKYFDY